MLQDEADDRIKLLWGFPFGESRRIISSLEEAINKDVALDRDGSLTKTLFKGDKSKLPEYSFIYHFGSKSANAHNGIKKILDENSNFDLIILCEGLHSAIPANMAHIVALRSTGFCSCHSNLEKRLKIMAENMRKTFAYSNQVYTWGQYQKTILPSS